MCGCVSASRNKLHCRVACLKVCVGWVSFAFDKCRPQLSKLCLLPCATLLHSRSQGVCACTVQDMAMQSTRLPPHTLHNTPAGCTTTSTSVGGHVFVQWVVTGPFLLVVVTSSNLQCVASWSECSSHQAKHQTAPAQASCTQAQSQMLQAVNVTAALQLQKQEDAPHRQCCAHSIIVGQHTVQRKQASVTATCVPAGTQTGQPLDQQLQEIAMPLEDGCAAARLTLLPFCSSAATAASSAGVSSMRSTSSSNATPTAMLCLADVSTNRQPCCCAKSAPSCHVTCRWSCCTGNAAGTDGQQAGMQPLH